jgi:hypothetical protein
LIPPAVTSIPACSRFCTQLLSLLCTRYQPSGGVGLGGILGSSGGDGIALGDGVGVGVGDGDGDGDGVGLGVGDTTGLGVGGSCMFLK